MVCPIAGYKINEKNARVVGGLVVLLTLFGLWAPFGGASWIFLFLAQDFAFRAFSRPSWSVLGRLASRFLQSIGVTPRLVDAGPKRFAARIGLLFTLTLVGLTSFDLRLATDLVAGVLLVCAMLEASFGFCLGCEMWTLWYSFQERIAGHRVDRTA